MHTSCLSRSTYEISKTKVWMPVWAKTRIGLAKCKIESDDCDWRTTSSYAVCWWALWFGGRRCFVSLGAIILVVRLFKSERSLGLVALHHGMKISKMSDFWKVEKSKNRKIQNNFLPVVCYMTLMSFIKCHARQFWKIEKSKNPKQLFAGGVLYNVNKECYKVSRAPICGWLSAKWGDSCHRIILVWNDDFLC